MTGLSTSGQAGLSPWAIGASIGAHIVLVGGLIAAEALFGPSDTERSMVPEHTMVLLMPGSAPKQQTILPERPTRTPDAPEVVETAPKADKPPPKQSELAHPEKKKPEEGKKVDKPRDRSRDREALLKKARKEALVKDPNAALGDRDQARTSPNGSASGTPGQGLDESDPEFAAWLKATRPALLENWVVIEADRRAHSSAKVIIWLQIKPDGTLDAPKVHRTSGVASIDRAAVMAVFKTRKVAPPPARLQADFARGLTITFNVSELR